MRMIKEYADNDSIIDQANIAAAIIIVTIKAAIVGS